jgi:hypothetical protein
MRTLAEIPTDIRPSETETDNLIAEIAGVPNERHRPQH